MRGRFDDEDVKIAPEDLSKLFEKENPVADDNIDLFIRQRGNGNTERARALGGRFVEDLLDCVWTKPPETVEPALFELEMRLLFAYAIHRIIEDYSPNSIVAHTALSSVYERLEDADPGLFSAINDNPAFSLYLYLHRSGEENTQNVGLLFAELCGKAGDTDCAAIGEGAYARFLSACAQKMLSAGYVD